MSTISRYALVLEEEEVITSTPQTESDSARQWLASLDLEAMLKDDIIKSEFYRHEVSIFRGESVYYLSTRSPQQRAWRRSMGTGWARGDQQAVRDGLERFISQMERKVSRRNEQKEAKRQARSAFVNPYKVGDVLYSSWGYDQTNVEMYQIVEVRELSLRIRQIAQDRETTGYDCGTATPRRDDFKGPAHWVTIQISAHGYHSVPSPVYGHLSLYEGRPVSWSSYA